MLSSKPKIVFLGMLTKIPVAGAIWGALQYLIGFERLGYEVYYVEAHARTPSMLMEHETDDGSAKAAHFIDHLLRRFDLGDRWAFHALHDDGRCYGMSVGELNRLYRSASLLINYHGGTVPLPEHYATSRLVYLGTDPVEVEIELYHNVQQTIDFMAPHSAFFTWGLNYGNADCKVPVSDRFAFRHTPPPVVVDLWEAPPAELGDAFTTIGNWRQREREILFQNQVYHWSKHYEFLKFLELPQRTQQTFELALSSYEDEDKALLERHGWRVRHALDFSTDLNAYRNYVARSRGEFTVAKDQNVRLRSGWFSERSAQYLAAGRPVITQDTGFGSYLPAGRGLYAFSTMAELIAAVERINSSYEDESRAARDLAREHLNYDVVLKRFLADCGL